MDAFLDKFVPLLVIIIPAILFISVFFILEYKRKK